MIDAVEFEIVGGNGGNGVVSFRREKFVPQGGPDGGDGGRGGDVIIFADPRMSTLQRYRDQKLRHADNGRPGGPNQRHGAAGASLELPVPRGSVVWNIASEGFNTTSSPTELADLNEIGAQVLVARGGRGGHGNKRFATSTRQAPTFAQRGQQGKRRRVRIELKLIADVGLIGLPNAGKSTLLSNWSRARPKIAAYPFTTLEPELGVVDVGYDSFIAADMPGLIKGASEGIGLGHEFLRHIERTKVLIHVLDMSEDEPISNLQMVNRELAEFSKKLADKPQLLALNKLDQPDAKARQELLVDEIEKLGWETFEIAAATGLGTRQLAQRAHQLLSELDRSVRKRKLENPAILHPEPRRARFEVTSDEDGRMIVTGSTPEWLAETLDLTESEPRAEFFDRLKRLGVSRALNRLGIDKGDPVRIGDVTIRWENM